MKSHIFEQVQAFLPKYLTPETRRALFEELEKFPSNVNFYLPEGVVHDELLQGDGWEGFVVIHFHSTERKNVAGMILSNSCDMAVENARALPTSILFAPLIRVDRYVERLRSAGRSDDQIEDLLGNIRSQTVTSIVYLPSGPYGPPESIILLDDIHSHPTDHFLGVKERKRLFRLNQYGFYILLIKLSIHFSRFQEGVKRSADPVAA